MPLSVHLSSNEADHREQEERSDGNERFVIFDTFIPAVFVDTANIKEMVIAHPDVVLETVPAPHR